MNSTLQAVIITLGIFAFAGLFGLIEALGDRSKWLKREETERTRTTGVIVGFAEERHGHPYTATADFYYLEMRGQDPKRPPEGSAVILYFNPSNPFKFHLEQDDHGNKIHKNRRS